MVLTEPRGTKQWIDAGADAIVKKWSARLPTGWRPTASNVLRYLDTIAEEQRHASPGAIPSPRGRPRSGR